MSNTAPNPDKKTQSSLISNVDHYYRQTTTTTTTTAQLFFCPELMYRPFFRDGLIRLA